MPCLWWVIGKPNDDRFIVSSTLGKNIFTVTGAGVQMEAWR
jgi:hypothetical protein